LAKFHAKRHNRSENIPKSFRGYFLKHPVDYSRLMFSYDAYCLRHCIRPPSL